MKNSLMQGVTQDSSALTFDAARYLHISTIEEGYSNLIAKYGILSMTAEATVTLVKIGMPVIGGIIGGYEVYEAPVGTKTQKAFEVTGEIIVGTIGGLIGGAIGLLVTVGTGGVAAPEGVAITFAGTVVGGIAGSAVGDDAYNEYIKIQSKF